MRSLFFTLFLGCLLLFGCTLQRKVPIIRDPKFIEVTSSPEIYDGKIITVRGWIRLERENFNLFWSPLERADVTNGPKLNCMTINNPGILKGRWERLTQHYVRVTAKFTADLTEGGKYFLFFGCSESGISIASSDDVVLLNDDAIEIMQ